MFGKPADNGATSNVPARPIASDVAKIQGKGLVQLIVTELRPMNFYLFVNDKIIVLKNKRNTTLSETNIGDYWPIIKRIIEEKQNNTCH